jgi:hypothetical protein
MSEQEFSRLDVLSRVQSDCLRIGDAGVLLACSGVRYFVCCAASTKTGSRACLFTGRARPSNHLLPAAVEERIVAAALEGWRECLSFLHAGASRLAAREGRSAQISLLRGLWWVAQFGGYIFTPSPTRREGSVRGCSSRPIPSAWGLGGAGRWPTRKE